MRMSSYLRDGFVRLELEADVPPPVGEDGEVDRERHVREVKQAVLDEITGLFDATGNVDNRKRLFEDLWNREKKAGTGIGNGIAIPHVRSKKVRTTMLGFARSTAGYDWDAPDGKPVRTFIAIVGPSFDSDLYLRLYKEIAAMFKFDGLRKQLEETWNEHEVYQLFDGNY